MKTVKISVELQLTEEEYVAFKAEQAEAYEWLTKAMHVDYGININDIEMGELRDQ